MPIIDAYDAIAKGAREQKRHFSPSGLSDLDRRAFLVGDRGVLHAALSDFAGLSRAASLVYASPNMRWTGEVEAPHWPSPNASAPRGYALVCSP